MLAQADGDMVTCNIPNATEKGTLNLYCLKDIASYTPMITIMIGWELKKRVPARMARRSRAAALPLLVEMKAKAARAVRAKVASNFIEVQK